MQALSIEYLTTQLKLCWTPAQLAAAAKEWPSPATWAWFLGARLDGMSRDDAMLRVHVAIAALAEQRVNAPLRPSLILAFFRDAPVDKIREVGALMGAWMDATDNTEARGAFAQALTA